MIAHSREAYQPTSIMRWDRGIFHGSSILRFIHSFAGEFPDFFLWQASPFFFGSTLNFLHTKSSFWSVEFVVLNPNFWGLEWLRIHSWLITSPFWLLKYGAMTVHTVYPCSFYSYLLKAMDELKRKFEVPGPSSYCQWRKITMHMYIITYIYIYTYTIIYI